MEEKVRSARYFFEEDVTDVAVLEKELFRLVEQVGKKLREENLYARGIAVQIRTSDFLTESTSKILRDPTHFDRVLFHTASELIRSLVKEKAIRLIGFSAQNLSAQQPQLDLFRTPKAEWWERFYKSLDGVRAKFGFAIASVSS